MTLLIFDQWENGVDIYTDTLVVDANHQPAGHATKTWTFPHLRLAMALTGTSAIGDLLAQQISATHHLDDIDDVDALTPDALRETHRGLTRHHGDIGTATVYFFGFPAGSDELTRIIYRSALDYRRERNEASSDIGIKPPPQHDVTAPQNLDDIITLAERVRAEQASGASGERIPIGGRLLRTRLTVEGLSIGAVHQFPDDTDWKKPRAHEARRAS